MTPFETTGYWFLPEDPRGKVAGKLRYSPDSGAKLELFGTLRELGDAFEATTYPLIHGVVSESPYGRKFSLVDCFRSGLTMAMPGVTTERVTANRVFVGSDYIVSKETKFAKAAVSFSQLAGWMNPRTLTQEPITDDSGLLGFQIAYRRNPPELARLDAATLSLSTSAKASSDLLSATIVQKCQLVISEFDPASHDRINSEFIYPMQNFFTLATDNANAIESLQLWVDGEATEGTRTSQPYHYLGQPVFADSGDHCVRQGSGDGLFFLSDIPKELPQALREWLRFCGKNQGFCDLFFGQIYAPPRFVEARFEGLVRSVMLLFRELASGETAQCVDDMGFMVEGFLLPTILHRALELHRPVMQPLVRTTPEDFVRSVVHSLSHCVSRSEKPAHALTGVALYWLERKLDVLLRAHLLDIVGFSTQAQADLFQANRDYQHLCTVRPEAE